MLHIYIPARNEEHNIVQCLESILNQAYAPYKVLVIDDASADNTAQIVQEYMQKDPRIHLLQLTEKPKDWVGKTWALHQGIQHLPNAVYYLFIDADVQLFPYSIQKALDYIETQNIDMLSGTGKHQTVTLGEKLIQPLFQLMFYLKFPASRVNNPKDAYVNAIGQFILIKSSTYQKVGGYPAIQNELTDDIALAKLVKTHNAKLFFASGEALYLVRMYHSFAEAWAGWQKNLYLACHSSILETLLLPFFLLGIFWLPGLGALLFKNLSLFFIGILLYVFYKIACIYKKLSFSEFYTLVTPFTAILLLLISLHSIYTHTITKRVCWKDRTYPVP